MQSARDESVWKNLALAFGDGLAFGVGVTISNKAASRVAPAAAPADAQALIDRLNKLEQNLERTRQNDLPGGFNQKAVEAVASVVDRHLHEGVAQFEQKVQAEIDAIRADLNEQVAANRKRAEEENQILRGQLTALHRQFAESLGRLVEEQIAATIDIRLAPIEERLQRLQPVHEEIAELRERVAENDQKTLELVLALGQLCLQTAERLSLTNTLTRDADAPPVPEKVAEQAEAADAEAPKRPLWRIPLVSSFFMAAGGLLLLHYL